MNFAFPGFEIMYAKIRRLLYVDQHFAGSFPSSKVTSRAVGILKTCYKLWYIKQFIELDGQGLQCKLINF